MALPLVFLRDDDDRWRAVWLHLQLPGWPMFNQVENNSATTTDLVRALVQRQYLTVGHLVGLLADAGIVSLSDADDEPVTYLGLEPPNELPTGSTVFTPANLADLIPD